MSPFDGFFAAMRYLLHHHPHPIQAVSGGYLPAFTCPPCCCGGLERGKSLSGQHRCFRHLDLLIAMRVDLLVDARFDGCVKSYLVMVVGEVRKDSTPFAAFNH